MQIGVQTWKVAGCCLGSTGGRAGDHDLLRFRLLSREGDRYRALRRSRERDRDLEGERDLLISAALSTLSALSHRHKVSGESVACTCTKSIGIQTAAARLNLDKKRQPGPIWIQREATKLWLRTPENGVKQRFCGFVVLQTLWPETMTKIPHHCTPQMIERFASIRTRRLSCFRSSQLVQLQLEQ